MREELGNRQRKWGLGMSVHEMAKEEKVSKRGWFRKP